MDSIYFCGCFLDVCLFICSDRAGAVFSSRRCLKDPDHRKSGIFAAGALREPHIQSLEIFKSSILSIKHCTIWLIGLKGISCDKFSFEFLRVRAILRSGRSPYRAIILIPLGDVTYFTYLRTIKRISASHSVPNCISLRIARQYLLNFSYSSRPPPCYDRCIHKGVSSQSSNASKYLLKSHSI
jgi:hypothetical protein